MWYDWMTFQFVCPWTGASWLWRWLRLCWDLWRLFTILLRLRLPGLTGDIFFSPGRDGLRRHSRQESHSNLEVIELIAVITSSQVRACQYQLLYSIVICDLSGLSVILRNRWALNAVISIRAQSVSSMNAAATFYQWYDVPVNLAPNYAWEWRR
jgi:hypothetical protein